MNNDLDGFKANHKNEFIIINTTFNTCLSQVHVFDMCKSDRLWNCTCAHCKDIGKQAEYQIHYIYILYISYHLLITDGIDVCYTP